MTEVTPDARFETRRADLAYPAVRSVSGVLPCYNDAATIGSMVGRLHAALSRCGAPFEIIVVDDGSTDGSDDVLTRLEADVSELRVVRHGRNRGYGAALRSGFGAARFEWVFYTDGDGQYDAEEVTTLLGLAAEDVDWVQGWKLTRHDAWFRRVIGKAYHRLVRLLFRTGITDTDCDFRLIRRAMLDRLQLGSSSGAVCAEMAYKGRIAGARIVETPVHHYARPVGRSQFFRIPHVARTVSELLRLWWRVVVLRQPVS